MTATPMSWDEAHRRIGAGEPVEDVLDEKHVADRESFRAFLADMGGKGVAAFRRYDEAMRDLDSSVTQARNAWHSISAAQRAVLVAVAATSCGRVVRRSIKPSVYALDERDELLCRVATVRNPCAHALMAWDGGAFEPERAAVVTERGRFVLSWGNADAA